MLHRKLALALFILLKPREQFPLQVYMLYRKLSVFILLKPRDQLPLQVHHMLHRKLSLLILLKHKDTWHADPLTPILDFHDQASFLVQPVLPFYLIYYLRPEKRLENDKAFKTLIIYLPDRWIELNFIHFRYTGKKYDNNWKYSLCHNEVSHSFNLSKYISTEFPQHRINKSRAEN